MPNPYPNLFVAIDAVISTPNSSEGRAIIIASLISVAGMAIVQFFNLLYRKIDFEERRFFNGYRNRIILYTDVITVLSDMMAEDKLMLDTDHEMYKAIAMYAHDLETLLNRLKVFGSPSSIKIISSLLYDIKDIRHHKDIDTQSAIYIPSIRLIFLGMVEDVLPRFLETVRIETDTHIVEKYIHKDLKIIKKLKHYF
jgi:hypothetical protein